MKKIILSILSIFFIAGASVLRAENIGVPAECEDVMLQAFYWDSYKTSGKYGCTKWAYLTKDSVAIRDNFDLVWFPPSAKGGGVGYYHLQLSSQDSEWGAKSKLKTLIAALHRGGTKVIADIVINHRNDAGSWTNFMQDNFGEGYGSFQLEQKHICSGDEAFTDSSSPAYKSTTHGAADTGENDGGCRDLDHSNEYVQSWAKAYVRWMLEKMQYDGFRYDMTRGYDGKYLGMYNEAAKPYFSVSEFWLDANAIAEHLAATGYNTLAFDFPRKWDLNDAFSSSNANYGKLKGLESTLRGKGLSRYTVTFVDNHDTFDRDNNCEFAGDDANLDSAKIKNKILQANAYILMMPGVPCVFYPHWVKYKEAINELIKVRKMAGIHSESVVSNEVGSSTKKYYGATIQGHRGSIMLYLGPKRTTTPPEGYHLALEGANYGADFTIYVSDDVQAIDEVSAPEKSNKFIKNGMLYIRRGEKIYDITGRLVE